MGWDGLCGGPMTAVFDDAAEGDRRAAQQAQSVCALCPIQERCRQQVLESPPWPSDEGPRGVVAGSLLRRRASATSTGTLGRRRGQGGGVMTGIAELASAMRGSAAGVRR